MKASALFVMIAPIPAIVGLAALGIHDRWDVARVVGLMLLLPGIVLLTLARVQLGNAFSIKAEARMLVTHGLYARIRNPVYVFGIVTIAGLMLYEGRPWLLVILVPVCVMQVMRARREAAVLEERFGEEYRRYRAGTWF